MNNETNVKKITPEEARELMTKSKKTLSEIYDTINTMATAGHNYVVFGLTYIDNPDSMKEHFIGEGFNVTITENHFSITW